ncbi:hypothetical protein PAHAL_8G068100 [Panicum hallii]|uniref:Uncharacterized protein n=1 Tax=Panicum hallii TaxID=206008 RepID=A0A2T8I808_9POAL|nr:hypothetical protein PAHAL_8G068100 [Panicum hallii]
MQQNVGRSRTLARPIGLLKTCPSIPDGGMHLSPSPAAQVLSGYACVACFYLLLEPCMPEMLACLTQQYLAPERSYNRALDSSVHVIIIFSW